MGVIDLISIDKQRESNVSDDAFSRLCSAFESVLETILQCPLHVAVPELRDFNRFSIGKAIPIPSRIQESIPNTTSWKCTHHAELSGENINIAYKPDGTHVDVGNRVNEIAGNMLGDFFS